MKQVSFLSIALCCGLFAAPSVFAGISGRVIDQNHKPLSGATVRLVANGASVTTKTDGTFELLSTGIHPASYPVLDIPAPGNAILFSVVARAEVSSSLFDAQGRFITHLFSTTLDRGTYAMNVPASVLDKHPVGVYFTVVRCGEAFTARKIMSFDQRNSGIKLRRLGDAREEHAGIFIASAAATDTLRASKNSYYPRHLTIASYSDQNVGDLLLYNDVESKVDSVLKLMTLKEKVAQMTQVHIGALAAGELKDNGYGSLFNCGGSEPPGGNTKENWKKWIDGAQTQALQSRLKIPMIYGIDAVHGNGKTCGSTIFPHNIGLGCTGDTALIRRIGEITAKECAGIGAKWAFAPCCAAVRNERWGRSYEGFGETGEINALMIAAMVRGMQGNLADDSCILACPKHYGGEGGTNNGGNQGTATMSDEVLRKVHLPPYLAASKLGAGSVMTSYHTLNGEKCSGNAYLMNKLLKGEMGFDGFIVSDWDAIATISAPGNEYQDSEILISVNGGMDMAMTTWDVTMKKQWMNRLESLVASPEKKIPISRIDDAVRRILRIKFRLRLWDRPYGNQSLLEQIGCQAHRDVARAAVRKSLVLLKNKDKTLPLKKDQKVVVCGEWADKVSWTCGGWTKLWQGSVDFNNNELGGTSLLKGMTNVGGANVVFRPDGSNIDSDAAAVVVFFGEIPYSEGSGDYGAVVNLQFNGKSGDYKMYLDLTQILAECDKTVGTKFSGLIAKIKSQKPSVPIICVLISGRPLIINSQLDQCDAFVAAWLPGSEGQGVAEVLYGDHPFTGKLTHTWPESFEQIPINTDPRTGEQAGSGGTPRFPYGYGLSY